MTLSAGLWMASRSPKVPLTLVLDLSLIYAVICSLGIASVEHLLPWPQGGVVRRAMGRRNPRFVGPEGQRLVGATGPRRVGATDRRRGELGRGCMRES